MESYESRWDTSAATPEEALLAVDGSASEETLKSTGESATRLIRAALDLQPEDRVFELGCGVARIGSALAGHCAQWHGADISGNMLKVAEERLQNLDNTYLHKLDRTELSGLEDGQFDKAYCAAVLIHLDKEDVYLYLKELARVLKPGGFVYFDTWNHGHPVGWKRWMMEVDNWAGSDQRRRKDISRNQFCLIEELRLFMDHAGLEEIVSFTNSPWNQVIAGKAVSAAQKDRMRRHVEANLQNIRYSERWSELFNLVLDVYAGRLTHDEAVAQIAADEDEEAAVFRDYLQAQSDRQG